MHVIIVSDYAHINGGQAKVSIESALGLAARGHKVEYFSAVGPIDPRMPAAGIQVECLGQGDRDQTSALAFLGQTLWNRKAASRLAEVIAASDPADTLVHVHAWAKAISPSIGPVLARSGRGLVYTMHEFFLVCPTGGLYNYQSAKPCELAPMSLACVGAHCDSKTYGHKLLRVARSSLVNMGGLKSACPHVVTISQLQFDVTHDHMPKTVKWHRVDNPIDAEDIGPKAGAGREFLFVGRLSREKGIDIFCEAARRAGVTAVIAGDGSLGPDLRARYPEARFLGWKTPQETRALMREARALVFPSVWYEGQPLTVFESLAMGTPVIVSDVCAGREAVADGENGLWFKSADVDSLAAAIKRLSDTEEAERMTRNAHQRYWSAPLDMDRHLDAIERVYVAALSDASAARRAA